MTRDNSHYPFQDIQHPHAHDVLCGRGGGTNNHVGNLHWRMLVAANKELYVSLPKRQKMLLSKSVVNAVRNQDPPGRFLQKDANTNLWSDIGDQKASEKTSQALREGAPQIKGKTQSEEEDSSTTSAQSKAAASKPPTSMPEKTGASESTDTESSVFSYSAQTFVPPRHCFPEPLQTTHPTALSIPTPSGLDSRHGTYFPPHSGPNEHVAAEPATGAINRVTLPPDDFPGYAAEPPPQLQTDGGFSFGSIVLSDAEQERLEQPTDGNRVEYGDGTDSRYGQKPGRELNSIEPVDGGLQPAGLSSGSAMSIGTQTILEEMAGVLDGELQPAGLSFGTMMSIGTAPRLETMGMSFGSVNGYARGIPATVDGGLEAIGMSFGSLSLGPTERKQLEDVLRDDSGPAFPAPAQVTGNIIPPLLQQRKSKSSLLDCSDTESEDEEDSAKISAQKSADWARMKATFEVHQSHYSGNTSRVPVSTFPLSPQDPTPSTLRFPTTNLARDFSQMSAMSDGGEFSSAGLTATANTQRFSPTGDYPDMPPPLPPPPPPSKGQNSDSDDWQQYERTLLNRGASLAAEEFNVPYQPE
jgi:hypothetical protein